MTSAAPGWYPDPSGNGGQRWWDGTTWTQQAPYTYQTAVQRAPEGARTNTPWIWLIIVLPLVTTLPLFFVDWGAFVRSQLDTSATAALAMYTSPAYLLTTVGGWVVYGLVVFFAYRDYRFLQAQGVPRPFHWAFAFLSTYVYPIGRAVVVKRRTGGDGGILAWSISALVVSFVLVIVLLVVMMNQVFASMSTLYGSF